MPDDWQVIPIKEIATLIRSGGTPSRRNPNFWNGDIRFGLIEDITSAGTYLSDTKERITSEGLSSSSAWLVPAGAVLLSMYATIGATTINSVPLATNQAILAIVPKPEISSEYLAFALRAHKSALSARNVQATQKNINKGIVETFPIPIPPFAEQRRIAHVLSTFQTAIEQQERLIALTRELKAALMKKLFTEGLRGEKQKETEIGLVPESWKVLPLGEIMDGTPKNGMYKPLEAYGKGTLILRINDFSNDGDVVTSASNRIGATESELQTYSLQEEDIVTNRVNSLSHLGKTALVGKLAEPLLFESNMMKYRVDTRKAVPSYVMRLLNSPIGKVQIIASAKRAVAQSSINQGSLKAVLLPVPKIEEQREIQEIIDTVIRKIEAHSRKKAMLEELFRSFLHQLMTAQIRVNNIDLPDLN